MQVMQRRNEKIDFQPTFFQIQIIWKATTSTTACGFGEFSNEKAILFLKCIREVCIKNLYYLLNRPMYVCLLASKKYSNTLESEIDKRLENILKNGKEAARVLRLGSTNNITETNKYKLIEVIWCANFVV